ncbi:ATP-binding protein [Mucilaginibacter sabulilitoris]|uniref:histidine kinase n=1 Tax=Mucilaginibacter sabulilitoris TaxID=1173583 RepID=A0ABZ0TRC4_9SPHI|nr:ATP-binding protein [Mucilaginibacter sabulilitoris]WPU95672.1 ATP-binding protein [Mucilaginibacter sabulilitoris]
MKNAPNQASAPTNSKSYLHALFDIKNAPKRAYQLGIATLGTGFALAIYDQYLGLSVSAFLVTCFCIAILMFLILKYQQAINNLKIAIISTVCALLVLLVCLEGIQTEQYLYFFPLMVAIPILIDFKDSKLWEPLVYILLIIVSFSICIFLGFQKSPLEAFNAQEAGHLAIVNRFTAIIMTIIFASFYIIFEKKYIHELLNQSKVAIDSRTRFLSTMGHELRTPLNGIVGTLNLLKQDHRLYKDEYFQTLVYCSDHMLQQVNNILDFNRIEADKLEIHPVKVNMYQLLTNIGIPFTSTIHEKGLDLIIRIDPKLDTIMYADDLRLIQVFNNLLSNAIKFTKKGNISIDAQCVNFNVKTMEIKFVVKDTGIGIAPDDQLKVFESFEQIYDRDHNKNIGTGLGLTICVRLLKLMNSSITLQSEKNKGSQFSFNIKFERADLPMPAPGELGNFIPQDLSGIKILLVEDNEINMMVAKKILTSLKAITSCSVNGKHAIETLLNNSAYDIILMDLEMPIMSGFTAISHIKNMYPQIPVIAFTASLVDQHMLTELLESGFADCLLKPFKPQQLLSAIKKQLTQAV